MKILITGATGLIGRNLLRRLAELNHDLVVLSRNPVQAADELALPCKLFAWHPEKSPPPLEALHGVEAAINLAGEPIGAGRWTPERKKKIRDSRILSTRYLLKSLSQVPSLKTFISGSAIGFYGDRGDELLTEESSPGKGFLAEVCQAWELEAKQLQSRIQTVHLRTGIVLSEAGGALEQILRPFKIGTGGPLGSGQQWISWIHIEDLVRVIIHALENPTIQGPLNAVSPQPIRQAEFARILGKVIHRPAMIPAPEWAIRTALGEMADLALQSQRVVPQVLSKTGFNFNFTDLKSALENLIGYQKKSGTRLFSSYQWVPKPVEEVFPFFSDEKNLEILTPPWLNFHVLGKNTPEITQKTEIDYRLKIHGLPVHWRSQIINWEINRGFTDIQIKGPYSQWEHTHRFVPMKGGTLIEDRILYRTPGGPPLQPFIGPWVNRDVESIFNYRKKKIKELFGQGISI